MAELRRDPVTGRWVCLAPGRSSRPEAVPRPPAQEAALTPDCPFCEGHEKLTPPELAALRRDGGKPDSPGWQVRVVPNLFPAFSPDDSPADLSSALHAHGPALGACEVIIHSPDHRRWLPYLRDEQARSVMGLTWQRYRTHCVPGVGSIVPFYNHGRAAGASLDHPHGQLFSTRMVGPALEEELHGAEAAHGVLGACVYCRMIEEELVQKVRVVSSVEQFVAIAPYASRHPYECWILPRQHQADFGLAVEEVAAELGTFLKLVLGRLTGALGDVSLNWYIHSLPNPAGAWRDSYHWHLEIRPKLGDIAGFELATGTYINTVAPELVAETLSATPDPLPDESDRPG